jgi:hypothetical protein
MATDNHAEAMVNRLRSRPPYQLYDLHVDPYELSNLAADPAYAEMIKGFKADIDHWMQKQADDGHVDPEGMKVIAAAEYEFPYPSRSGQSPAR